MTKLTANLIAIAESMYAQCDPDGNQYNLLADIVYHRANDSAANLANQKVARADGRTYIRLLAAGWKFRCQWLDGSTSWGSLSDLKESHPAETAEYARLMGIDHKLAFNWWVMSCKSYIDR